MKKFYGNEEVEYQEVYNTGFIGVVFADLCSIDRFNFEFEMGMLTKLMKDMIIPVKELFYDTMYQRISPLSFRRTKQIRFRFIKPYAMCRSRFIF